MDKKLKKFYGIINSEEFEKAAKNLEKYAYFLDDEVLPHEEPNSKIPQDRKLRKKWLPKARVAKKSLTSIQNLFKECFINEIDIIDQMVEFIPIVENCGNRRKCKSVIKNLYQIIFEHNFSANELDSTILGFSSIIQMKVEITRIIEETYLDIFRFDADKLFKER